MLITPRKVRREARRALAGTVLHVLSGLQGRKHLNALRAHKTSTPEGAHDRHFTAVGPRLRLMRALEGSSVAGRE